MDLLLLCNGTSFHYVLITNLLNFAQKVRNRQLRTDTAICRNCFHVNSSSEIMERHKKLCYEHEPIKISMPKENSSILSFQNIQARHFVPIVIYFDLESVLLPLQTVSNDPHQRGTDNVEKHVPSGYCLAAIEQHTQKILFSKLKRSEDCMKDFVSTLEKLANDIYQKKQQFRTLITNTTDQNKATKCWICEEDFSSKDEKVADHDHYSSEFIGWAHSHCNLKRRSLRFTPVVAHNLSNYDLHHLMLSLNGTGSQNLISIIPETDERYVSLSLKVRVGEYTRKENGEIVPIYEELRFIDSFRFMSMSLDKLVSFLPADAFKILNQYFEKGYQTEDIKLLQQKGHYPYSYIDSFTKFDEENLPEISNWKNSLAGGETTVTNEQLDHAKTVFKLFGCHNLGDYHDLYLTTDTLLLACVFETFRKICYNTYGLDCAQYFSAPNLAGDAYLRTTGVKLELLQEREHLDLAENFVRGGIASVFTTRHFQANNKYLDDYDPTERSTYGLMIDANNLYGGIMTNYSLPLGEYELLNEFDLDEILNTSDKSLYGFILEVDLAYPEELHNSHSDFPLAPTKEVVQLHWLSEYQENLREKLKMKTMPKNKKLLQTLFDKEFYTIHYLTLQLYVSLGMKVTKVHRVIKFRQSQWLKPYIDLNIQKRVESKNKFEENFFKLMVNSVYGKLCENPRNRSNISICRSETEALDRAAEYSFKNFKIFGNGLATVSMRKTELTWSKPLIVGAAILDIAKKFMFEFHYRVMKQYFSCDLIYSDTDSLTYIICTEDLYKDINEKPGLKEHFDFSNYPKSSALFDETNKKTVLKFKDELSGSIIREVVALKAKMYSIKSKGKLIETAFTNV